MLDILNPYSALTGSFSDRPRIDQVSNTGVAGVTDPAVGSANLANVDYGVETDPYMYAKPMAIDQSAFGAVPIATGRFTPRAQEAANIIYGNRAERQMSVQPRRLKGLTNLI